MKTWKHRTFSPRNFIGILAILAAAFALAACDSDNGSAHTHEFGTVWKSNAAQHWYECGCGEKSDAANHTWGNWTQTKNPTVTEEGEDTKTCTVCEKTETRTVDKLTVELIADAGENQTVTLANGLTVTLDGSGSSGNITAYAWECTEYTKHEGVTAPYTTDEINNLITPATDLSKAAVALRKAGTYVFELRVKDTAGVEKTAEVTVVVEAYTVNQTATVILPDFTTTSSDIRTKLDLNPTQGDNWEGLEFGKLSITLTETDKDGVPTTYFTFNDDVVSVASDYGTGINKMLIPRLCRGTHRV
jgi:hypothetical protein